MPSSATSVPHRLIQPGLIQHPRQVGADTRCSAGGIPLVASRPRRLHQWWSASPQSIERASLTPIHAIELPSWPSTLLTPQLNQSRRRSGACTTKPGACHPSEPSGAEECTYWRLPRSGLARSDSPRGTEPGELCICPPGERAACLAAIKTDPPLSGWVSSTLGRS
jgi:hypothetical protein